LGNYLQKENDNQIKPKESYVLPYWENIGCSIKTKTTKKEGRQEAAKKWEGAAFGSQFVRIHEMGYLRFWEAE